MSILAAEWERTEEHTAKDALIFVSKNRNEHYTICIGASVVCVFVVWLIRFSGFNLWSSVSCADCQKVNYVYSRWLLLLSLLRLFCIECTCELFSNDCAPSLCVWFTRAHGTYIRCILFILFPFLYDNVCRFYIVHVWQLQQTELGWISEAIAEWLMLFLHYFTIAGSCLNFYSTVPTIISLSNFLVSIQFDKFFNPHILCIFLITKNAYTRLI